MISNQLLVSSHRSQCMRLSLTCEPAIGEGGKGAGKLTTPLENWRSRPTHLENA
jgi:hypothetical protein